MSKTEYPYWYKLLKTLKANGTIGTGLTIPYIFGAYEVLGSPFSSIRELIEHILESPIDKSPLIQKCNVIHHDVIMALETEVCNKYVKAIKFENAKKNNALFVSPNTNLGTTLEKIYSSLSALYLNPIERKNYSWDETEKRWKKFDKKEIEAIQRIK